MREVEEMTRKLASLFNAALRAPDCKERDRALRRLGTALSQLYSLKARQDALAESLEEVRRTLARLGARPEGAPWGDGALLADVKCDGGGRMLAGDRVRVVFEYEGGSADIEGETGKMAFAALECVALDAAERVGAPTPKTAVRQVRELVELLRPHAAGEEGDSDVVSRVRRLAGELESLRASVREESGPDGVVGDW